MKSIADLEEIRKKTIEELSLRTKKDGLRVVVGMATCGIAAGARPVLNAFIEELRKRSVNDVNVIMTGCIGLCKLEPVVEVVNQDGTKVTYVKMTKEKVERVVSEHIVNGKACLEYTLGEADK